MCLLFRLALQRGGEAIDDPLSWMSTLSKESIDWWEAYYSVEPFGDHQKEQAEATAMLYRIWLSQIKFEGTPPELNYDAFMPVGFKPPPKKIAIEILTPEQEQAAFCAAFGIKAS